MSIAQTLVLLAFAAALALATEIDPDYLYMDEDVANVEDLSPADQDQNIHARWKRSSPESGWKLPAGGMLKKARKLVPGYSTLPPNLKQAITDGDFSKVSEKDIQDVNVTILEYIPSKVFEKVNVSVLTAFIDKFVEKDRPLALGRLIEAAGDKLDTRYLLDRIQRNNGIKESNEQATNIMLYSALSKSADHGGITNETADLLFRFQGSSLLASAPEELLMKAKDQIAAKTLLKGLISVFNYKPEKRDGIDDQALTTRLLETAYGQPKSWTQNNILNLEHLIPQIPALELKQLKPEVVVQTLMKFVEAKYETPLQAKTIADIYFQKNEILRSQGGLGAPAQLETITRQLGKLSAFIPADTTKDLTLLTNIAASCEKLNMPAPLNAITRFYEERLRGNSKLNALKATDFRTFPTAILRNSPPEVLKLATAERNSISGEALTEIGNSAALSKQGKTQNSYFQGMIAQLSSYAVQSLTRSTGRVEHIKLPPAFAGAIGIKDIEKLSGNDIDILKNVLKECPDSFDDAQKNLLMKKSLDNKSGPDVAVPPQLVSLRPRKKNEHFSPEILDGLPSDSEYCLGFGSLRSSISVYDLAKSSQSQLVGTLTPKQVQGIDLEEIPTVLNIVRKSRDGPQPQALKALYLRLVEYIRTKTDDFETEEKKLMKYLTPAEISRFPATVLAYFIDAKQSGKFSDPVKKEIMIALGELSVKDYTIIPTKTREHIIMQGLDALEKSLVGDKNYTVAELAAIGRGVSDLPVDRIKRLSPVAAEIALEIIQGVSDSGLKQRACLNPDQRRAWADTIVTNYGSPDEWDAATASALCCSLELLSENELAKIPKEGIVNCKCISDLPPPSHLADLKRSLDTTCKYELGVHFNEGKKNLDKIKSEKSLDILDLESQILTGGGRKSRETHQHKEHLLTCYALRLIGSAASYDAKILQTLQPKDINNCLYELGAEKLSHENAQILWQKLVKSWESVERIPSENLRLANNVLCGINENEVTKLNFTDPDVVSAFGRPIGLPANVLKKMAQHFEDKIGYPINRFVTRDLIISRNILCGFGTDRLEKINHNVVREALPVLRSLDTNSCEQSKLWALANFVIAASTFGETSKWDAGDVRGVGILLRGLNATDAKKIPAEAFLGITTTVAQALPREILRELSPEQLGFIPRFSAQAMSGEQINSLSSQGRESLQSVIRGPLVTSKSVNLQSNSIWTALLVLTMILNRNYWIL